MNIAEEGVSLLGASGHVHGEDDSKPAVKPLQAMRLELEDGVLDNIVRTARSGGKGVHLSFGRTIVISLPIEPEALRFLSDSLYRHSTTGTDPNSCLQPLSIPLLRSTATPTEIHTVWSLPLCKVTGWL